MISMNSVFNLLNNGCSVNYGKLTICPIVRGLQAKKVYYQVDCNDRQMQASHIYEDIVIAIDKFVALYNILTSKNDGE